MKHIDLPIVCIVGRPNVGKSTLFNRIIRERKAVVHATSGTTRDSIEALYKKDGKAFLVVDTGGFQKNRDKMSSLIRRRIEEAIVEADLLLFVCDVTSGLTSQDEEIVTLLRKSGKDVVLAVNKLDDKRRQDDLYDFYGLGIGTPLGVSALHNRGIGELMEKVLSMLDEAHDKDLDEPVYRIAIAGRPNVGKSLFLNTLLKRKRVIVDDLPGTTRDSVDTYFKKDDILYQLCDTAGIRHKRKVKEPIDVYSMSRSREAIERSDATLLLIDGYDGLRSDDVRVFKLIVDSGKCCVLVVNKWDLVKKIEMARYKAAIIRKTPEIARYPIVFASAKTGRNVLSAVDLVKYLVANTRQEIRTKDINKALRALSNPKVRYAVQLSKAPPSFLLFVSNPRLVTKAYTHLAEIALRKHNNFYGTPIKINCRRQR